jgi:hypothetical protein
MPALLSCCQTSVFPNIISVVQTVGNLKETYLESKGVVQDLPQIIVFVCCHDLIGNIEPKHE